MKISVTISALVCFSTAVLAQSNTKTVDEYGCPVHGTAHYCSQGKDFTRMQYNYGGNYAVIGDQTYEDAADGYIWIPNALVSQAPPMLQPR